MLRLPNSGLLAIIVILPWAFAFLGPIVPSAADIEPWSDNTIWHNLKVRSHLLQPRPNFLISDDRATAYAGHQLITDSHDLSQSTHKPRPVRVWMVTILFAFDSAVVPGRDSAELRAFARRLPARTTLNVAGHADRIGSETYNLRLSRRRAEAVATILRSEAVKVKIWPYGESCPRVKDLTAEGLDLPAARHQNRRVVVSVSRSSRTDPKVDQECLR
jgi:outer membrane protein OmpA-like peptidoglycan-associated protein